MAFPRSGITIGAALTMVLTACAGEGQALDPAGGDLERCAVTAMRVDELDSAPNGTCELGGATIIFPDGTEVVAPYFGGVHETSQASATRQSDFYTLFNLGVDGVVAAQTDPDRTETLWWGTTAGLASEQERSGDVVR